ncbi:flagellar filament capping protein FliD [Shewanella sp.]|uniref:flagellar filament capping protein FliD n=1 Tax=Shewanella sp. TaxID=50422 RepID=UPI003A977A11
MATSTSSLSMDPAYMAEQYTQLDRAAKDQLLTQQYNSANAELKAFTALRTSLTDFADSLKDLLGGDSVLVHSATASNEDVATVTADSTAASGTYELHVDKLAQAHQIALSFGSNTTLPTSGDLGISVGGSEFVVDLSSLGASAALSDVARLVNNSADNTGVTASVMRSGGGDYLVFTSNETGAANNVSLSYSSDGSAAGDTFANAITNQQELTAAQDASVRLGSSSSITLTSSTNSLEGIIDGVTIDLKQAQTSDDSPLRITVGEDTGKTAENLNKIVKQYNDLMDGLVDDDIGNDSMARNIKSLMRSSFQGVFEGSTLYSIGIEFNRDGKMELDTSKLEDALETNSSQVSAMLTGENGVLAKLNDSLSPYSDRFGFLKTKVDTLTNQLSKVEKKQQDFDTRMQNVYTRYLNQFTQMQITISQLQSSMSSFSE